MNMQTFMMRLLPSVLTSSLSGIQVNPTSKTFSQSVSFYLYRYRPNTSTIFWASVNSFLIGFPASTLAPVLHSTARVTGSIKHKSDLIASLLATLPRLLIALGITPLLAYRALGGNPDHLLNLASHLSPSSLITLAFFLFLKHIGFALVLKGSSQIFPLPGILFSSF
ncbi:hypothetical protein HJG60_008374 [Phyllostomus discolor]|uniref:Uncharacterized protein n=1 Tax=Phyllostomus discolor TaxID=89673 RepID=A0A833Z4H0_9CHIR|nr:hypothetical protein HJG60_008374 [Phyllostomus discolor]